MKLTNEQEQKIRLTVELHSANMSQEYKENLIQKMIAEEENADTIPAKAKQLYETYKPQSRDDLFKGELEKEINNNSLLRIELTKLIKQNRNL
jgi:hypothetical protein